MKTFTFTESKADSTITILAPDREEAGKELARIITNHEQWQRDNQEQCVHSQT